MSKIVKNLPMLCLSFFVSFCGKQKETDRYFLPYITELEKRISEEMGRSYKIKTPIIFVNHIDEETLAYCEMVKKSKFPIERLGIKTSNLNVIKVSRDLLNFYPSDKGKQDELVLFVLLHEIGHCEFGRDHDFEVITREKLQTKWEDGSGLKEIDAKEWRLVQKSVMWPYCANEDLFDNNSKTFIRELIYKEYPSDMVESFVYSEENTPSIQEKYFYKVENKLTGKIITTYNKSYFMSLIHRDNLGVSTEGVPHLNLINDVKYQQESDN